MKTQTQTQSLVAIIVLLLGAHRTVHAGAVVDFDPTGEFATQFNGGAYSENTTGGLNGSIGINLASLAPTTFDGSQSESYTATDYNVGDAFTVGAFFKLSAFGGGPGTSGQVLRLGLTNGGTNNFANLPFSTIELTGSGGEARLVQRETETQDTDTFSLATNQWYYFETTFTRDAEAVIAYDMTVAGATAAGVIGSVIESYSVTNSGGTFVTTELDKAIYGGFKGHDAFNNGAIAVLDNFYVSISGESQIAAIPTPTPISVGLALAALTAVRRRR